MKQPNPSKLTTDPKRVNPLKAIVCDVDGTLTEGSLLLGSNGEELKQFNVHDGLGIAMAIRAGLKVFFLTSRPSAATRTRGQELGVTDTWVARGSKVAALDEMLAKHALSKQDVCYIGDDLTDMVPIRTVLLGVAVSDAHPELREVADLICTRPGGHGAVREVIELILQVRGDWERIVQQMDPEFTGTM